MVIAWPSFLYSEAPWERNRFYPPRRRFRFRVSLLTERDLWGALGAINISLLWSENDVTHTPQLERL